MLLKAAHYSFSSLSQFYILTTLTRLLLDRLIAMMNNMQSFVI